MADDDSALHAAVRLAGPERGHALLGCDWGTRVALPNDREVCIRQAKQRVAIHGMPEILDLKLCEAHATVHQEATGG